MEVIFKIIFVALLTSFAVILIKPVKSEFAVLISIVGGVIILAFILNYLSQTFGYFELIINKTGVNSEVFGLVLRVVGIGYLTEFAASLCSDCGNPSLAEKLLFAGKIVLLVMSLPIVMQILDIIMELLP